jgi:hypothetical protein
MKRLPTNYLLITQPRIFLGGERRPARKAEKLAAIYEPIV